VDRGPADTFVVLFQIFKIKPYCSNSNIISAIIVFIFVLTVSLLPNNGQAT